MRTTIVDAGFALVLWNDVTEGALRFLDAMVWGADLRRTHYKGRFRDYYGGERQRGDCGD